MNDSFPQTRQVICVAWERSVWLVSGQTLQLHDWPPQSGRFSREACSWRYRCPDHIKFNYTAVDHLMGRVFNDPLQSASHRHFSNSNECDNNKILCCRFYRIIHKAGLDHIVFPHLNDLTMCTPSSSRTPRPRIKLCIW